VALALTLPKRFDANADANAGEKWRIMADRKSGFRTLLGTN